VLDEEEVDGLAWPAMTGVPLSTWDLPLGDRPRSLILR